MSEMLTVMAGFFNGVSVPESTVYWVDALRPFSQRMVLVFDNPPPTIWPEHWLTDSDISIFCEPHGEYDFGSYKRGMAAARAAGWLGSTTHLLLTNDSVIGPLSPLAPVLACMQANDDEAWGLTQSDQITPHLQSYFLVLGKKVFEHQDVQAFFDSVQRQKTRHAVIEEYELGFSRVLLAAGLSLNAWLMAEDCLDPRNGDRMGNPTSFPCAMVERGVPVIKTKALRDFEANKDSFSLTTKILAQRNPELWQAVWRSAIHKRLWQDLQSVTVLLNPQDYYQLDNWLEWIDILPHKNCRLSLSIPLSDSKGRAQILNRYKFWIEKSRLLMHSYESIFFDTPDEINLISAIAAVDSEWFCLGSQELLHKPAALLVQLRRSAANPLCNIWSGLPIMARRSFLLASGSSRLLEKNID